MQRAATLLAIALGFACGNQQPPRDLRCVYQDATSSLCDPAKDHSGSAAAGSAAP
jgi:hypothetical protein